MKRKETNEKRMNEERKYETDIAQPNRGNGVDTKDLVGRGDDYLVNQ